MQIVSEIGYRNSCPESRFSPEKRNQRVNPKKKTEKYCFIEVNWIKIFKISKFVSENDLFYRSL